MQTTSLVATPNLMENLPFPRYSVIRVVQAVKAIMIQLEEMKLARSLEAARHFGAMVQEMEEYLAKASQPQAVYLNDGFAERVVILSKQLAIVLRQELATTRRSEEGTAD